MAGKRSAQAMADVQQILKQARLQKYVAFHGPLKEIKFSVPADTLAVFRRIQDGFSSTDRPIYLLYGPPQFGKTTIANAIEAWVSEAHPNIICVNLEVNKVIAADEAAFWSQLGMLINGERDCRDFNSIMSVVSRCTLDHGKKFCLILDNMDTLLMKPALLTTFLDVLRMWKAQSPSFLLGFLGVGGFDLEKTSLVYQAGPFSSPFNVAELIKTDPFTSFQMTGFSN
ncbi:unnamed protein product [Phytophthora lilii]|uniref:Unnamed protein product n=1 Tax=Phytophthora lilii TaxID=2077276 RepID=A0A9W6U0B5_9STRA|nr:unnamed protein product [Phytophthora lilii]